MSLCWQQPTAATCVLSKRVPGVRQARAAYHSTRSPPPPPSAKGWKNATVPCVAGGSGGVADLGHAGRQPARIPQRALLSGGRRLPISHRVSSETPTKPATTKAAVTARTSCSRHRERATHDARTKVDASTRSCAAPTNPRMKPQTTASATSVATGMTQASLTAACYAAVARVAPGSAGILCLGGRWATPATVATTCSSFVNLSAAEGSLAVQLCCRRGSGSRGARPEATSIPCNHRAQNNEETRPAGLPE